MTPIAPLELRIDFESREMLLLLADDGDEMSVIRTIETSLKNGEEVSFRLIPDEAPEAAGRPSDAPGQAMTSKLVVTGGSEKEEHEGLTLRRANIATKVN